MQDEARKEDGLVKFLTATMLIFGIITLLVGLFATLGLLETSMLGGVKMVHPLKTFLVAVGVVVMLSGVLLMITNKLFYDLYDEYKQVKWLLNSTERQLKDAKLHRW